MLDGISRPALPLSSIVRPSTNFQRRSSTGIGPVHAIAALSLFGEGMSGYTLARTAEAAFAEVECCCVLDGTDVARKREALVAVKVDIAAVRLELADREG